MAEGPPSALFFQYLARRVFAEPEAVPQDALAIPAWHRHAGPR
jgi:hypothetical protein